MRSTALLLSALLVACDLSVGDGTAPTAVFIRYNGLGGDLQTLECTAPQLSAVVRMEGNGKISEGDVTPLVKWSSSNPGVIDVSNGDTEVEPGSGSYFSAGTVIARTAGSAIIRIDYVGLSASFSVTADPILGLTITPELTQLAPGSRQTFKLEAKLEENTPPADVTINATWRVPSGSVPVGIINTSTVQVQSDPVGQPFTLEAQLLACDRRAQRVLQLGALQSLRVTHEQPEGLTVPLTSTDQIVVEGIFADTSAPPQNLSLQLESEQSVGDPDEATLSAAAESLVISGLKAARPLQFRLRYDPQDLEVDTRVVEFADLELKQLRIAPDEITLVYPDTFTLEAYGLFADGYERPVRRGLAWRTLDPSVLGVIASGEYAGEITPSGIEGRADVRASASNSEGLVEAEAHVSIELP